MTDPTLTVVVPAYNEQDSLATFLPELIATCESKGWRLVVVDDGSTDGTGEVLRRFDERPCFRSVRHKINRGYGGALKTGIRVVETTHLITIDADGQHDLEDLQELYDDLRARDADMVVGSRKGHKAATWYRGLGKYLIRFVANILLDLRIHDINSGMKVYDTRLAQRYIHLCPDSMAFSDVITLVFVSQRHVVLEKPIRIRERRAGTSTITTRAAFQTLIEILNIVVLFNPHRIFIPIALSSVTLGITWGLPIVLRGNGVSVGAMLAILTGIVFFFLGLVAEQVSLIRRNDRS